MEPTKFDEQNTVLHAPPGVGEDECSQLPVYHGSGLIISCWRLGFWERVRLLFTRRVWLLVHGDVHPMVSLTPVYPFEAKSDG